MGEQKIEIYLSKYGMPLIPCSYTEAAVSPLQTVVGHCTADPTIAKAVGYIYCLGS